jgi:hypothetical protein
VSGLPAGATPGVVRPDITCLLPRARCRACRLRALASMQARYAPSPELPRAKGGTCHAGPALRGPVLTLLPRMGTTPGPGFGEGPNIRELPSELTKTRVGPHFVHPPRARAYITSVRSTTLSFACIRHPRTPELLPRLADVAPRSGGFWSPHSCLGCLCLEGGTRSNVRPPRPQPLAGW